METRRRFFGGLVVLVLAVVFLSSSLARAESFIKAEGYKLLVYSSVDIVAIGATKHSFFIVKNPATGTPIGGATVVLKFSEMYFGELGNEVSQTFTSNVNGVVLFTVPPVYEDEMSRFVTAYAEVDSASVVVREYRYTADSNMPASLTLLTTPLVVEEGDSLVLDYLVRNAWGQALSGISVDVTMGDNVSPKTGITDSGGNVFFTFTADCNNQAVEVRTQVGEPYGFLQSRVAVKINGGTTPPPEGNYQIEAVDCDGWSSNDEPYWQLPIDGNDKTFPLVFVVKDVNGSPVGDVPVSVAYPKGDYVTGSDGKITVLVTVPETTGSDKSRVSVIGGTATLYFWIYYE